MCCDLADCVAHPSDQSNGKTSHSLDECEGPRELWVRRSRHGLGHTRRRGRVSLRTTRRCQPPSSVWLCGLGGSWLPKACLVELSVSSQARWAGIRLG